MRLPDGLISIIRQMAEKKDVEGLQYLSNFVHREIDKLKGIGAVANPHPPTNSEGAESEHCLTA